MPQPGGLVVSPDSELNGLSCTSASDCWAVGSYGDGSNNFLNQAVHWNGKKWLIVKMPEPDGTGAGAANFATAITCSSASNCWAVGYSGTPSKTVSNEALHWQGTKWARVSIPNPAGSATGDSSRLASIRCVSAKDCWAAGTSQVGGKSEKDQLQHWNSRKWS